MMAYPLLSTSACLSALPMLFPSKTWLSVCCTALCPALSACPSPAYPCPTLAPSWSCPACLTISCSFLELPCMPDYVPCSFLELPCMPYCVPCSTLELRCMPHYVLCSGPVGCPCPAWAHPPWAQTALSCHVFATFPSNMVSVKIANARQESAKPAMSYCYVCTSCPLVVFCLAEAGFSPASVTQCRV